MARGSSISLVERHQANVGQILIGQVNRADGVTVLGNRRHLARRGHMARSHPDCVRGRSRTAALIDESPPSTRCAADNRSGLSGDGLVWVGIGVFDSQSLITG